MGENGDFQPLYPKISRNSQTVSNAATGLLLTINWKFAVDFFAWGLHTRTAVARLPLRQLGFLVMLSGDENIISTVVADDDQMLMIEDQLIHVKLCLYFKM